MSENQINLKKLLDLKVHIDFAKHFCSAQSIWKLITAVL